jgi:multiple sugar transport system permease protein
MKRLDSWLALCRRGLFVLLLGSLACLASAKVTLHFTVWDGDESLKIIRGLIADFERQNPDIHIQLDNIADYNMYHQKMVVLYAANAAPDVAMMDPPHFQALAERGALTPLNQFFSSTPGFSLADYYKPIVDAHSLRGELYVLPRDIAPSGLIYYNKEMFKEAGIPLPDGSWTWDFKERPELREKDFLWVLHQLTKLGPDGKVKRYGFVPAWPGNFLNTLAYSYGLRYTDDPQYPTKVLTDQPGWLKVGDLIDDLMLNKKWMPSNTEVTSVLQSSAWQLFVAKKTATYETGIWEVPNIRKAMPPGSKEFFDWDITLAPAHAGMEPHMPTGGSGYAIFSTCPHKSEAWRFLTYMAGPPGMVAMAKAGIAQPAIRSVALSEAWLPGPNTSLDQQYPHSRNLTDVAVPRLVFDPSSELWPDAVSLLNAKLDNFYNGLDKPENIFPQGTKEAQGRLDYLRKQRTSPKFNWGIGAFIGLLIAGVIVGAIYWPERGKHYTLKMRRENRAAYWFLMPWIIGLVVFTLGPMILSLLMSTTDWDMIRPAQWRGAGNFVEAATVDPRFWVSLRVTFIYTLVRVPVGIAFALLLAMLLNTRIKGVPIFRTFFYIPSLVSAVAASLVWRRMYSPDGFINAVLYNPVFEKLFHLGSTLSALAGQPGQHVNWLGNEKTALWGFILMSIWGVGGAMVVLLAGLQGIPEFYYEAATVDGASPWHKLKAITLPLLTPAIFFTLVTGLIGAFQAFTEVFTITSSAGGPNNATMVYMLNLYKAGFESYRFGYVAALAWVLFAIIMFFTLIQFRMSKWVYYESDVKG